MLLHALHDGARAVAQRHDGGDDAREDERAVLQCRVGERCLHVANLLRQAGARAGGLAEREGVHDGAGRRPAR